jgi:hypothetical protein
MTCFANALRALWRYWTIFPRPGESGGWGVEEGNDDDR